MHEEAFELLSDFRNNYTVALCFLETKFYRSSWEQFRHRFERDLLTTAKDATTTDWFRNIHIFLTVVNDSQRAQAILADDERYRHV